MTRESNDQLAAREVCPNCGGTEHVAPLPGTVGRRCVKCCNVAREVAGLTNDERQRINSAVAGSWIYDKDPGLCNAARDLLAAYDSQAATIAARDAQIKVLRGLFVNLDITEKGTRKECSDYVREALRKVLDSIDWLMEDTQRYLDDDAILNEALAEQDRLTKQLAAKDAKIERLKSQVQCNWAANRSQLAAAVARAEAAERRLAELLAEILAAHKTADEERLAETYEAQEEAEKWKAEGDMYGWNFHQGRSGGITAASIIFYRVQRLIESKQAIAPAAEGWEPRPEIAPRPSLDGKHVFGPRVSGGPGVRCVNCFQAFTEPNDNQCEAAPAAEGESRD